MTLRKSSLPYPRTHTSPPQTQEQFIDVPRAELDVDSADLPTLPSFKNRSTNVPRSSPFMESENPWGDIKSVPNQYTDKPVPQILQAGAKRQGLNTTQNSANLPVPLRIGKPATITPRSSSESQRSKDFWEDDEDGNEVQGVSSAQVWRSEAQDQTGSSDVMNPDYNETKSPELLAATKVKRKPVSPSYIPSQVTGDNTSNQQEFASNNPFRREPSTERAQVGQLQADLPHWEEVASVDQGKGKEVMKNHAENPHPGILHQSGLEVDEQPWSNQGSLTIPPPTRPPAHPSAPPPPVPTSMSSFSQQVPIVPPDSEQRSGDNPWQSQLPPAHHSSEEMSHYNETSLDHDDNRRVAFLSSKLSTPLNPSGSEQHNDTRFDTEGQGSSTFNRPYYDQISSKSIEQYKAPTDSIPKSRNSRPSSNYRDDLLDLDDEPRPALPQRRTNQHPTDELPEFYDSLEGPAPPKPPRPALIISEATLAKRHEQRNETYQIKHFNWFDHHTRKVRRSSMLIQNKNGPCPLLALVNALILGAEDDSQAALDKALRAREQVSLGLMIETLIDELLSGDYGVGSGPLPDVDELNSFLLMLHTGMNANPRFVVADEQAPNLIDARNSMLHLPQNLNTHRRMGTFEQTQDVKLYGAFSVPLIHGWLPPKTDPAKAAFARSAPTYEDAQALQFGEEELEYKLSQGGLTSQEEQLWKDISAIKNFFRTYPTQLTPYGLDVIKESVYPGSFAILFRNDHFSTIFKHPETGQLFTLVTDAGYADRDEIIWESLVDVNGQHGEFFSGDFRPVGNNVDLSSQYQTQVRPDLSSINANIPTVASPISPQERQEQHDADFAMALQLQEEEEQASRNRQGPAQPPRNNRGNANVPVRLRPPQEARPAIPARTSRTQNTGVNRPSDPNEEAPPPTYDEAAKGRPYIPPVGSPLHPSADPSPRASSTQLTGVASAPPESGPGPSLSEPYRGQTGRRPNSNPHQRRMSAYGENSQQFVSRDSIPGSYPRRQSGCTSQRGGGPPPPPGRRGQPVEDRECIVM